MWLASDVAEAVVYSRRLRPLCPSSSADGPICRGAVRRGFYDQPEDCHCSLTWTIDAKAVDLTARIVSRFMIFVLMTITFIELDHRIECDIDLECRAAGVATRILPGSQK
jgi:hypothetical protein